MWSKHPTPLPFSIRGTMRSSQEAQHLRPTEMDVLCLQRWTFCVLSFLSSFCKICLSRLDWFVPEAIDIYILVNNTFLKLLPHRLQALVMYFLLKLHFTAAIRLQISMSISQFRNFAKIKNTEICQDASRWQKVRSSLVKRKSQCQISVNQIYVEMLN